MHSTLVKIHFRNIIDQILVMELPCTNFPHFRPYYLSYFRHWHHPICDVIVPTSPLGSSQTPIENVLTEEGTDSEESQFSLDFAVVEGGNKSSGNNEVLRKLWSQPWKFDPSANQSDEDFSEHFVTERPPARPMPGQATGDLTGEAARARDMRLFRYNL